MMKKVLVGLLILFLCLQFYRPAKNIAAAAGPHDLAAQFPVPAKVQEIFRRACYDCHSNNTFYPWYAEVQPVRWWLDSHITEGKRHLNFSDFGTYSHQKMADKLDEIIDQMEQHQMPLPSYTWAHPEARLTPDEIKTVVLWAEDMIDSLDN